MVKILKKKGSASASIMITLLLIVGVMGLIITLTYNNIVVADKNVDEAKGQIATVCQRRLDLIPNLIETVKGYAKHESTTLMAVTQARTSAQKALQGMNAKDGNVSISEIAATQAGLSTAMRGIFALVENYPNLRASSNFLALQDQLEGTENRIAVARQRYNSSVKVFNTRIVTFPGVVIAPLFDFNEIESWEAEEKAYQAPKVNF